MIGRRPSFSAPAPAAQLLPAAIPPLVSLFCRFFCALLQERKADLFVLQPLTHSLRVYPGWHQERFSKSTPFNRRVALSPVESALTDQFRVLTEIRGLHV